MALREPPPRLTTIYSVLEAAGWRDKYFTSSQTEGLNKKDSDMTSSVGKEGDDQYGDGRWLMMVRAFTVEICSVLIILSHLSTRGLSARPGMGSPRSSGLETISFRTCQVPGSGTRGERESY